MSRLFKGKQNKQLLTLLILVLFLQADYIFSKIPDNPKSKSPNQTLTLPSGLQTFQSASGSGSAAVTTLNGNFRLTGMASGVAVNVYADAYGAYISNATVQTGVSSYFEIRAVGTLGSFEITTCTIGNYNVPNQTTQGNFSNVYVAGYIGGSSTPIAQTTPITSSGWQDNFPIDFTPFTGKKIDYFRCYYTIGSGTTQNNFNFQDFSVTNSSAISVSTDSSGSITTTGTTLYGTVNANSTSTAVTFDYGTTTSYGTTVTAAGSPFSGASGVSANQVISSLNPGTIYHYRVKGVSGGLTTYGADQTFTTLYTLPSAQASAIQLTSNSNGTQINVSWSTGDGSNRAVFMKQGNSPITNPISKTTYTASSDWNSRGSQLGSSGYYCVYKGTGSSVNVINTVQNTQFVVQIFEFNGTAGMEQYLTSTTTGNPSNVTSLPVELTTFTLAANNGSVVLNWITATEVNNNGFEVERKISGVWETIGFVKGAGNSNHSNQYTYTDRNIYNSGLHSYRLRLIDTDGKYTYSGTAETELKIAPAGYELMQNYPNPFNPTTTIQYQIPEPGLVTIRVYNTLGKEVALLVNESKNEGIYDVSFNPMNLASGTYFYQIRVNKFVSVKEMVILK
jgi:hypothetical protein